MISRRTHVLTAAVAALLATGGVQAQALEEIVVTAQKREVGLQTAPVAVTAFTAEMLKRNRIFSVSDLAATTPSLSLTQGTSPLDLEVNIRGITNTRLDAPSGEAAVGTFVDDVFIGRTGGMNTDYYDIERIEVIRGPQGVLLGKGVIGGALSIITAKPEFENSGAITVGMGNYDSQLLSGHVTGGLSDDWAGRVSIQTRRHDGYAYDVLHDRELDNWDSQQIRAQLLYQPDDSKWSGRLVVDYSKDSTNGQHTVAIPDAGAGGLRPYSTLRTFLGLTDPRVSAPDETLYAGDTAPTQQYLDREAGGMSLNIEADFDSFTFNSITGYRTGHADSMYSQIGIGPDVFDSDQTFGGVTFDDFLAFNAIAATYLFSEPVREDLDYAAFSQEFRLTSTTDGNFDWIAGVFYKNDEINKFDKFVAENPSATPALVTLSGQSNWDNRGDNTNIGVFGQIGYRFSDAWRLSVGARYTSDEKKGHMDGIIVTTGDRFNPDDTTPTTPLQENYSVDYGATFEKTTPQATLEWTPNEDLFLYGTVSTGFKGGYFQDTASNGIGAAIPTRPEEVINYELGIKSDFAGGRARLNAAAFYMDYTDLQLEQTNQDCLCNIAENASDADITGVEVEFTFAVTEGLLINISGTALDLEYVDFVQATGVDSSGNVLQRAPESMYGAYLDWSIGPDLNLFVNYAYQGELYWEPLNVNVEDSYGLLDARLTFAPESASWAVSVWGKNVTDELYRVNIIPFFGEEISQFGPPATYGVDFSYSFE
jgi:iron complex outermembrane receptor protein